MFVGLDAVRVFTQRTHHLDQMNSKLYPFRQWHTHTHTHTHKSIF